MKRFALLVMLFSLSAGAQAEWARVGSNSNGTGYLWYPVEQYFPLAYPELAGVPARPIYINGWRYRARSIFTDNTVDCRDGRVKVRYGFFYSGANLNGYRAKIGSMTLSNGLNVVPGRWYAYSRLPGLLQKAIRWSCQ